MKSISRPAYKTLATTALAVTLSLSLLTPDAHTQEAPPAPDIELQKVDSPRKTGRTRPSENAVQMNQGSKKEALEMVNPTVTPSIRRLDPDKVEELRTRIRSDRAKSTARNRSAQFQEERAKNIQRLVQIEHIRKLAEENNNTALAERAGLLRDREMQRHVRTLARLREENGNRRQMQMRKDMLIEKTERPQEK